MSCFRLLDSVLGELERILADFFWQGSNEPKIHWLAWSKLCISKAQGGLGFRRLREFNLALLRKQAWRISMYPECLPHQILSQKYFPGLTFFEARLGARPSYTWRSVWETRDILAAGVRWRVGNGQNIAVIGHPWLPRPVTFQLIRRPHSLTEDSKVAQLINPDNKWNVSLILSELSHEDADCILSVKPRGPEVRDELIWHFETKGCFSVKSAYRLATKPHEEGSSSQQTSNWKFIWKSKAPPKVVLFAWRCVRNLLPTAVNLKRRGVPTDSCVGCAGESEDSIHFLLNCSYARLVWGGGSGGGCFFPGVEDWFNRVHRMLEKDEWELFSRFAGDFGGLVISECLRGGRWKLRRL
ncbi:UNVERIFIED_CONTAM: hypothetical protein Slati_1737400 [Sesamum latifolium]|uniref:Reverse transcriptase zinc-binding domain-containing protein n=1 Tax=Sesamum latifolium TaxID=2727402 RepID=A0AAW2WWP2_9LAMI